MTISVLRSLNWFYSKFTRFHTVVWPEIKEMWSEERSRRFLWAPVVLGAGIGAYYMWPYEPDPVAVFGSFAMVCPVMLVFRRFLIAGTLFVVFLGFSSATLASMVYGTPMLDWPTRATQIKATIVDVEQHKSGRRLLLEDVYVEALPLHRTPDRMRMVMPRRLDRQAPDVKPGQSIEAVAKVLPFSEPMMPDGFDFRRNAFLQGIGATGYLMGKVKLGDSAVDAPSRISVWFAQIRQDMQAMVKRHMQGDAAGLAIILLTGDKTSLSPETMEAMRSIGLAHLLAIAGLHIGLVAGVVFFFVRALLALFPCIALRFPIKKWAAAAALLAIVFFTLQVGAPVPTRRALFMTGVALLGIMADRLSLSLRTVALAAFVILLIWPYMLLHPAFQLSFAAVTGLIAVGEWARAKGWRLFPERDGAAWSTLRHILGLAGMSVVATLATVPFCLYHFQEAEVYSVLANTLAIPLTAFWLMPLCVLTELCWLVGLEVWPLKLLEPGLELLIGLTGKISSLPGAHYRPPPMPMPFILAATFGGLFFTLTQGRKRWAGLAVLLTVIGLTFFEPRMSILLGPDGKQAGWWNGERGEILITAVDAKPNDYLAGYWGERYGYKKDRLRFVAERDEGLPPLACDESRCVGAYSWGNVAWIRKPEILERECTAGHKVVINPHNRAPCAEEAVVSLTRDSFRSHGAHAIYGKDGGFRINFARHGRALRPWSVGWRPERQEKTRLSVAARSIFSNAANFASVLETKHKNKE